MTVLLVLVVLLSLAFAVPARRAAGRAADRRIGELGLVTGVLLDPAAAARLRTVVVRRTAWPAVGRVVGLVSCFAGFLFLAGDAADPASHPLLTGLGGGLAAALGTAAGSLAGHLAVGCRGFPSRPGGVRTVRVDARRLTDYVARSRLLAWRCSAVALVATVVLDVALLPPVAGGGPVVAAVAAALLLGLLSVAVRALLLRRRVTGPTRGELVWQEAVLADSLQLITSASLLTNVVAVGLGTGAVLALRDDLAGWGPLAAWALTLACALAAVALARPLLRDDRPPALQHQGATT